MPSPSSATVPPKRPPMSKRASSSQSQVARATYDDPDHTLRGQLKPSRKTKVVLPRNNNSARNLAKLGRVTQDNYHHEQEGRRSARKHSHDADTEIRLPGSLDEGRGLMLPPPTPVRRNLTSQNLPKKALSHAKLKKNFSHGQLHRAGEPKARRHRSADLGAVEKDLHEREVEIALAQQTARNGRRNKKVGFAFGSVDDSSDSADDPHMEGSGLQDDEWTDQSNSNSPSTTRQNTANSSRRPSVIGDKVAEQEQKRAAAAAHTWSGLHQTESATAEDAGARTTAPEPRTTGYGSSSEDATNEERQGETDASSSGSSTEHSSERQITPQASASSEHKSSIHSAHRPLHPLTKQLLERTTAHTVAPALVSTVSTLDDSHVSSTRGSPALSVQSSRSHRDGTNDREELVSRFIPTASHPTSASGTTAANTPKTSSLGTPEQSSSLASHDATPATPDAAVSTSSTSVLPLTPATLPRSRTEARLQNDRIMSEMLGDTDGRPTSMFPGHVFDRRNETLKSYRNLAALGGDGRGGLSATTGLPHGPEIFQGRFKAVNTELAVVQRFRDPIAEAMARLERCSKPVRLPQLRARKPQPHPARHKHEHPDPADVRVPKNRPAAAAALSASPMRSALALAHASSLTRRPSGRVTFDEPADFAYDDKDHDNIENYADDVADIAHGLARSMWDGAVPA